MNTAKTLSSAVLNHLNEGEWKSDRTDETAAHAVKMLKRVDRITMTLFVIAACAVCFALVTMSNAAIAAAVVLGLAAAAGFLYADHGTSHWQEAADARWVWHNSPADDPTAHLHALTRLHNAGVLTTDEFTTAKTRLLR